MSNVASKWNKRASLVYAAGVWAALGLVGYYVYMGDDVFNKVVKKEEKIAEHLQVVHKTAHTETVVVYKEDFVPYTTRIYNYFFSARPGDDR
ncbi:hypothetical protein CRUP_023974 [Coryphaenoides rupestris]|nr:hypothetical protein CRUP_023974 [Coryphaenoides rupestris]